ncbi:hypothetical protein CJJ23_01675 [Mycoplasmopsis agassizii]|uniref:Uncharacterized protein n=1 Tax=Mycoplasmopsis agassizii TaxID=33922 RepID=A0A269TJ17_9BACT|nr:hypothetical protein [Mycoplasmopsis agassizii]PAK21483.1 hypothetical protein CJJ23_01675 [Mycoplasmopsis agassizii]
MFSLYDWIVIFVAGFSHNIISIFYLFIMNKLILWQKNRITTLLHDNDIPIITFFVKGVLINSKIRQIFVIEMFIWFFTWVTPLMIISIYFWIDVEFISDNQDILSEKIVYGLTGVYSFVILVLTWIKIIKNHRERETYLWTNTLVLMELI